MSFQDMNFISGTYERLILSLLEQAGCKKISKHGEEIRCSCPFHDDEHPSFSININTGAWICHGCNEQGSITDFVAKMENITTSEAYKFLIDEGYIENNYAETISYTVEDFSLEKKLPIEFLKKFDIKSADNNKSTIFPYYDINNIFIRNKYRNNPNSSVRFFWDNTGNETTLYGMWALKSFNNSYVILAEGETDTLSCWFYNIQCIGVPGAKTFKKDYAQFFERFEKIYIHDESDNGAKEFINKICSILPNDKLFTIKARDIDNNCKDLSDLHCIGKLNFETLIATAKPIIIRNEIVTLVPYIKKDTHVINGEQTIKDLHLNYYNGKVYTYENGVYKEVNDIIISSHIVKNIDCNATATSCKKSIDFIKNWLFTNETKTNDSRYINYSNGIFDIKNNVLISHTPDIFTVNQLPINYLAELGKNQLVDTYLDDIMDHVPTRVQALLQIIGYCQTSSTDLQKAFLFLGAGANGKSELAKIIEKMTGIANISNIDLQTFAKQFGSNEINQKLVNIVSDLPAKTIDDAGTFKALISGDTFMADVKYKDRIRISPYAKHIFTTNVLPPTKDTSMGFFRRLNILLFTNKFEVGNSNFNREEFYKQENLDYFGNKALREYLKLLQSGHLNLANEEESQKVLASYRQSNDTVYSFLTEYSTTYIYNVNVKSSTMRTYYLNYCEYKELKPIGKKQFFYELQNKYSFVKKLINGYEHFYRSTPIEKN